MLSPKIKQLVIRSGGQSGVDRAAIDFANENDLEYTGYCPKGGWAEDFTEPPGLLLKYPKLRETKTSIPDERTELNVKYSDATILIHSGKYISNSKGTALTIEMLEKYKKPYLKINIDDQLFNEKITKWINQVLGKNMFDLNIAGPRESESTNLYLKTLNKLNQVIAQRSS